jgi:hypothetical protein
MHRAAPSVLVTRWIMTKESVTAKNMAEVVSTIRDLRNQPVTEPEPDTVRVAAVQS